MLKGKKKVGVCRLVYFLEERTTKGGGERETKRRGHRG